MTDVIPTSNTCNAGIGAGRCLAVPPATIEPAPLSGRSQPRFVMDGVRGELEYSAATMLPYTNARSRATGTIYLKATVQPPPPNQNALKEKRTLHVFLEDIPFSVPLELPTTGGQQFPNVGLMRLYLDHRRFSGPDGFVGPTDELFEFNMFTGQGQASYKVAGSGDQASWTPSTTSFKVAKGKCAPDPSTSKVLRCSGELSIPLKFEDLAEPAPGLQPGIGFALTAFDLSGSFPKDIAEQHPPTTQMQRARSEWQTLLFGPPRGFPVKYMTWNVRRFESGALLGDFQKVSDVAIGEFLAPYDVVAIQEGWDKEKVEAMLKGANERRKILGLPPFAKYGPIDFDPPMKQAIEKTMGNLVENSGTHGGLWIFSRLPFAKSHYHVYSPTESCRGEDCFKAKGVQWVRLYLNPPDALNTTCNQQKINAGPQIIEPPLSCPPSPSGDHFIDIFNTHLQAGNASLCDSANEALSVLLKDAILEGLVGGGVGALDAITKLMNLAKSSWNCNVSEEAIRDKQLIEMNDFIEQVTKDAKDRPVIVMGDFNLDGKTLSNEYPALPVDLRIGPMHPGANWPTSDVINPFRYDYDWDVDHGDLVRERTDVDFTTGEGTGTLIWDEGGTFTPGKPWAGNFDAQKRFDYILVRPPYPPDAPEFKSARWVAAKQPNEEVWSSPWPGLSGNFGPAPARLSDHKPVVTTIVHAPLAFPPPYHPNWRHSLEMRVDSADATGEEDCWGCHEVDLYPRMILFRSRLPSAGGGTDEIGTGSGSTCLNENADSYPADECTYDWYMATTHQPSSDESHSLLSVLVDDDSTTTDDPIGTLPAGGSPIFKQVWNMGDGRGAIYLIGTSDEFYGPWPVTDNAPIRLATQAGPPLQAIKSTFTELPPGQQF